MAIDTAAPRLANATERRVHQLLVEQLGDDGVVIAGKRVRDQLVVCGADLTRRLGVSAGAD